MLPEEGNHALLALLDQIKCQVCAAGVEHLVAILAVVQSAGAQLHELLCLGPGMDCSDPCAGLVLQHSFSLQVAILRHQAWRQLDLHVAGDVFRHVEAVLELDPEHDVLEPVGHDLPGVGFLLPFGVLATRACGDWRADLGAEAPELFAEALAVVAEEGHMPGVEDAVGVKRA